MNPRPAAAPRRPREGHKGTSGRVLLWAGSAAMPGAALLAARAAMRGGAGLLRLLDPEGLFGLLLPLALPEAVRVEIAGPPDAGWFGARDEHALLIGPGLGMLDPEGLRRLVREALEGFRGPVLLDADALNVFAGRARELVRPRGVLVLTPHPGEAGRLLGAEVGAGEAERAAAARELARRSGAVCVLKGAGTRIDDGQREARNPTGDPALSTAGSGDVLAGLLAAYLCNLGAAFDAFAAARAAVWVHGRAGELCAARLGERGTLASDLIEALPGAQRELEGGGP